MDIKTIKTLFEEISVWKRGNQRAPHKPLLILYALASIQRDNGTRLFSFSEIDSKLQQLLVDFGPTRASYHAQYPFWRLQKDGIWELNNIENITENKGGDVKRNDLLEFDVHGGFTKEIYDIFTSNKEIIPKIALSILERNFPESMHEDILQAVGLNLIVIMKRDPEFRGKILNAYEHQCAICGFNARIGNASVVLEAAHIKWHQAGGPSSENNGLLLCALHHKLFDRGAFKLTENMEIIVSDRVYGTGGFKEWLMEYHHKELIKPQRSTYCPKPEFIAWHAQEVFQGVGRE